MKSEDVEGVCMKSCNVFITSPSLCEIMQRNPVKPYRPQETRCFDLVRPLKSKTIKDEEEVEEKGKLQEVNDAINQMAI